MPLLMYGVTASAQRPPAQLAGLSGEPVRLIDLGEVGVVVSELRETDLLPRRRNLTDFQRVIHELSQLGDVLPMSFGMVSDDETELARTLGPQSERLRASLTRISGKAEFAVRLVWRGENVFAWFVETREELRQLRDRYFADGRAPNQQEKLHLGQTFERLLQEARDQATEHIIDHLGDLVEDQLTLPYGHEACLANVALLVQRAQVSRLDQAIEALAPLFPDDTVIELNGPWPPYSFVNLGG